MEIKLALVGIGIWSHQEYLESKGKLQEWDGKPRFAIVKLGTGTPNVDGEFFFPHEDGCIGRGFFPTPRAAMEYALRKLKVST